MRGPHGASMLSRHPATAYLKDFSRNTNGPLDHDDFGSNRSKTMNVIDSNI
jgi:hypothetical protein